MPKIFCIGLHKTGTSSLHHYAKNSNLNSTHSINWNNNFIKINSYDFFCDGGSHFNNTDKEFNFIDLYTRYPDSKFILQTRDTKKWVISKCKHCGWENNTVLEINDITKLKHDTWRYKSILNIEKFITHKIVYESKVMDFFEKNDKSRLLIIDVTTNKDSCAILNKFLGINVISEIPHVNKCQSISELSTIVINQIDKILEKHKISIDKNTKRMDEWNSS